MTMLLLAAVMSPALAAAVVAVVPERQFRFVVTVALGASMLAALVGPTSFGWWHDDRLARVVATASLAIALWTILFAIRQFGGERRLRGILATSMTLVTGIVSTDLARSPLALLTSWTLVSALTVVLLRMSERTSGVVSGLAGRVFALGDGLLVAVILPVLGMGAGGALTGSFDHAVHGWRSYAVIAAACVAATARAGLSQRRSWVTATINTPTSTSALLHAGVVNAGAILLWRLHTLAGDPWPLAALLATSCALGLVRLIPLIHARVDLKGQLAASTVAQMAFMLLALSLGLPLLALTHLIGHGVYKAARFMGAGSAIEQRARLRRRRERGALLGNATRVSGAAAIAALCLASGEWLPGETLLVMALFGTAAVAIWWVRSRRPLAGALVLGGALVTVVALYGLVVAGVGRLVGATPWTSGVVSPWWSLTGVVISLTLWSRFKQRATRVARVASLPSATANERPPAVAA